MFHPENVDMGSSIIVALSVQALEYANIKDVGLDVGNAKGVRYANMT